MSDLVVRTCAKVNFCLRVLGRRSDGYHEVETVLHTIGLWDRLHLSPLPGEPRIALKVDVHEAPADESNLCWQAARLLSQRVNTPVGVSIELEKSIPAAAGLGGGSSDAAATLAGLARMWRLDPWAEARSSKRFPTSMLGWWWLFQSAACPQVRPTRPWGAAQPGGADAA
jgi:4-diphosphocytidyl-2-C-methyl-D-erythritol kinase